MLVRLCCFVQSIYVFSPALDLGLCVNGARDKVEGGRGSSPPDSLIVTVLFIRRTYRPLGPGSSVMKRIDLCGGGGGEK